METYMAVGPVQLITLGFPHPNFHGEIIAELERLRDGDTVRVIDALAVYKDGAGDVEVLHLSNLTRDEAVELGSVIGALIGLAEDDEEGMEAGAVAGGAQATDGFNPLGGAEAWDILDDIPNDSAAALVLAGGYRISDGFISPLDLIEAGLYSAEEAAALHALETSGARA